MKVKVSHCIAPNQLVLIVDVVLKALAVLASPAGIKIIMSILGRLRFPCLNNLPPELSSDTSRELSQTIGAISDPALEIRPGHPKIIQRLQHQHILNIRTGYPMVYNRTNLARLLTDFFQH